MFYEINIKYSTYSFNQHCSIISINKLWLAIQVFSDINPCRVVIRFGEAVCLHVMLTELH